MKISIIQIAFAISLLGILLLLFLTTLPPQKTTPISDITFNHLNKNIKIQGKINKIRTYNTEKNILQILEVSDIINPSEKIEVALINPRNVFLRGQNIILIGKVQQYKDSLQIQTEKISIHGI